MTASPLRNARRAGGHNSLNRIRLKDKKERPDQYEHIWEGAYVTAVEGAYFAASLLAAQEEITLTEAHWEVVRFVRDFYLEFNTSPAIRMLVKAMANKFGEEKGNSRYLYRLFPKGPAKQATKIAGLPKPVKCI